MQKDSKSVAMIKQGRLALCIYRALYFLLGSETAFPVCDTVSDAWVWQLYMAVCRAALYELRAVAYEVVAEAVNG